MSFNEDVERLRKKLVDVVEMGLLGEPSKGVYELTLLQIMNESERQRQNCVKRAESLKMQAAVADGQAAAFGMISSIVNNVVNSLVRRTEAATDEEKAAEEEKSERAELIAKAKETAAKRSKKKTTRKKRSTVKEDK